MVRPKFARDEFRRRSRRGQLLTYIRPRVGRYGLPATAGGRHRLEKKTLLFVPGVVSKLSRGLWGIVGIEARLTGEHHPCGARVLVHGKATAAMFLPLRFWTSTAHRLRWSGHRPCESSPQRSHSLRCFDSILEQESVKLIAIGLASGGLRRVRTPRTERYRTGRHRGAEVSRRHGVTGRWDGSVVQNRNRHATTGPRPDARSRDFSSVINRIIPALTP